MAPGDHLDLLNYLPLPIPPAECTFKAKLTQSEITDN
jgi:hypothetical protein